MPSKGKHKAAQVHAKVERNHNTPTVRIVNQIPTQRFRYNNEGRTGRRNQNRSFLELEPNFGTHQAKYRCTVFCVCDTDPNIPHPNALVGKDCRDGVYCAELKAESKGILKLPHLQIERKKKGDVQETWDLRAKQLLTPYKERCTGLLERKFATSKVRLYVHVEALDTRVAANTLSGIITSEREGIQVDIHALSHYSAAVTGGETIYILTSEAGPDIKPGDFEVFLSTENWSSTPKVLKAEDILYKKVIKYEVPPYVDKNITDAVTVLLTLNWIRSKQRVTVHFQYRPEPDIVVNDRRHQLKRVISRDHAGRDGPSGKVMRFDPHLTQPLNSMHGKKMTPGMQDDDSEDYLAQSPTPPSVSESDYAAQVIAEDNSGQAQMYQVVSYPGQVYTEDVGEAGERKTYAVLQSSNQPHNMPLSPVSDAGVEREEEMEVQTSQHSQCTEPQNPVVQPWYTGKNPIQLNIGKSSVMLYPIEEPATTAGSIGKQALHYVQAQQCSEDTATTPSSMAQGTGYSRGKIMYEVPGPSPPSASPSGDGAGGKGASENQAAQVLVVGKGKPTLLGKTRPTAHSPSIAGPPSQGKGKPGNIPNFISGLLDPDDRGQLLALRLRDKSNSHTAPTSSSPPSSASASAGSSHMSGKGSQAASQQMLMKTDVLVKTECEDNTPKLPSNLPSFGTGLALTTSLPSIPFNLDPKLPSHPILPGGTLSSTLPSFNLSSINLTSMDIEKDCGPLLDMAKEDGSTKS